MPGDKSISHRAAMLGAVADGETRITGFLDAEDTHRTLAALRALGAEVEVEGPGRVRIHGAGLGGLRPAPPLDCGNSGTTLRLLLGLLAGCSFETHLDGDASLRRRPMADIAEPLGRMGAAVRGQGDACFPPVTVRGGPLRPIAHACAEASAQVKSAVLLAGLYADGVTTVTEPHQTRDHTERLLRHFGVSVTTGVQRASVGGPARLRGAAVRVPGDISAAAFLFAAAAVVPGSRITVAHTGINPTRTGMLDTLQAMGAAVSVADTGGDFAEPCGAVTVSAAPLRGVTIGGAMIPRLIDEAPVLLVAAAVADGETALTGAQRLRVKESDRIGVMTRALRAMGADIEERGDGAIVRGPAALRGADLDCHGDHRVAMALAVAGLAAEGETVVPGAECIATSFPAFPQTLAGLGAPVAMEPGA